MSADVEVLGSEEIFRGHVVTLRRDTLRLGGGEPTTREIVEHLGAVVVVALDADDQVVLVNQYRHPVQARLDELPAGLLDVGNEPALDGAQRELAEEALLGAARWHTLVDLFTSPGFTDEAVRVFLARDLSDIARPDGFVVEHEEAAMTVRRVPLSEAVDMALAGEITNAAAVAGILAAQVARAAGWSGLRPADAPWDGWPRR